MAETQTGKGRGCFFYGCLTLVVVLVVGAFGLYFGTRYLVNRLVARYTSPTPMAVPRVEATPEEIRGVQARFKEFAEALQAGRPAAPLSLSERELNLLLNHAPQAGEFKDHVHVAIVGNKLRGTLSLPLERLGLGWRALRGRYFNGMAEIKAVLENGILLVTLDALEVNGQPVPERVMAGIRSQNLAKDLYKDAASVELLKKLEAIAVEDGRLLIRPRAAAAP